MMRFMWVFLIAALLIAVSFEAYRIYAAKVRAVPVLASARAFERAEGSVRILVAGDSTGVGTGSAPELSIAGRLASAYPEASVKNISENGLKIAGLLEKLRALPESKYDLILLQIGGNDILGFSSVADARRDLRLVFAEAKKRAEKVAFMSTGDVGNAPAFGPLLSLAFTLKTKEMRSVFMEESKAAGVTYIDLYVPRENDPFAKEPLRYHAADGLHPTGEGYGLWFEKLLPIVKSAGF
jgi:lysophospholipase L1-like esterase